MKIKVDACLQPRQLFGQVAFLVIIKSAETGRDCFPHIPEELLTDQDIDEVIKNLCNHTGIEDERYFDGFKACLSNFCQEVISRGNGFKVWIEVEVDVTTGERLEFDFGIDSTLEGSVDGSNANGSISKKRDSCSICLMEFESEKGSFKTSCLHEFHFTCILNWLALKSTCPVCRSRINIL